MEPSRAGEEATHYPKSCNLLEKSVSVPNIGLLSGSGSRTCTRNPPNAKIVQQLLFVQGRAQKGSLAYPSDCSRGMITL